MINLRREFRPFAPRGRGTLIAIVATFALVFTTSALISVWSTGKSRNRATILQVAARQRTLAERYVAQVLLVDRGAVQE